MTQALTFNAPTLLQTSGSKSIEDFWALTENQKKLISYIYKNCQKANDLSFLDSLKNISTQTDVAFSSVKTTLSRLAQKNFFQKATQSRKLKFSITPTLLKLYDYFLTSPAPKIVAQKGNTNFLNRDTVRDTRKTETQPLKNRDTKNTDNHAGLLVSRKIEAQANRLSAKKTGSKNIGFFKRVGESERQKILRVLGFVLCFFITAYLVTEGAMFFSKHLKTDFNPLVLSLCIEFLLVFFAGYKFRGAIKALTAKTLMTGIFLFSVGSYSYFSISSALKGYNFESRTTKISKTLSSQIREKQNLIKEYSQKGWIGEARKLSREKHHLTSELLKVQRSSSNQLPMTFLIGMVLAVSFRVLLQFANVFIAHELLKEG